MKNQLINYTAFGVLALLWAVFAAALVFDRPLLGAVWESFRSWPILGQLTVALLTLPVVLALWIWNTSWPLWLRLVIVLGLAWATVYTFFQKKAQAQGAGFPAKA
jgi:hypothetical protein